MTNNSIITITDIACSADSDSDMNLNSEPLICFTDKLECCQINHLGEWYLPDGNSASQNQSFLITREDDGTVILTRSKDDVLSPTGLFCCSVQNSYDVIQSACVNVGKLSV